MEEALLSKLNLPAIIVQDLQSLLSPSYWTRAQEGGSNRRLSGPQILRYLGQSRRQDGEFVWVFEEFADVLRPSRGFDSSVAVRKECL